MTASILECNKDAYVSSGAPTTNYDTTLLKMGTSDNLTSYVGFDITGIDFTDRAVWLFLRDFGDNASPADITAERVTSSWTETGVTWNTKPTTTATNSKTNSAEFVGSGWYCLNVTDMARDETGSTLSIQLEASNTTIDVSIGSRTHGFGWGLKLLYSNDSTLLATQDTHINSTSTTNEYGGCITIRPHDGAGLIEFDTTNIVRAGIRVEMITYNSVFSAADVILKRITSAWSISTAECSSSTGSGVTYATRPTTTATNSVSFSSDATINPDIIDITDMFYDSSGSTFGVEITTTSGLHHLYKTKNAAVFDKIPFLRLTEVRFVKTGGNDGSDGKSWANAWKTIDKAANTAVDGMNIHIEGGTYDAEPAANDIAPVNAGTTGIKYTIWGTAGSGVSDGTGTGTVTVEKNT